MSLKEKLVADMTAAMKAKDANRLSTLRMAKAALMNEENKRGVGTVLSDEEVMKVLTSLVKQRKDSIEQFTASGRAELAEKEKAELEVLEEYLPQAASAEEIAAAVESAIAETGASSMKEMGLVMKAALAKLAGKNADGKLVSETVKSKLASLLTTGGSASETRREELFDRIPAILVDPRKILGELPIFIRLAPSWDRSRSGGRARSRGRRDRQSKQRGLPNRDRRPR